LAQEMISSIKQSIDSAMTKILISLVYKIL